MCVEYTFVCIHTRQTITRVLTRHSEAINIHVSLFCAVLFQAMGILELYPYIKYNQLPKNSRLRFNRMRLFRTLVLNRNDSKSCIQTKIRQSYQTYAYSSIERESYINKKTLICYWIFWILSTIWQMKVRKYRKTIFQSSMKIRSSLLLPGF